MKQSSGFWMRMGGLFSRLGLVRFCAAILLLAICPTMKAALSGDAGLWDLLRDPNASEWRALSKFDGVMTRADFERRLNTLWDLEHGMASYLAISNDSVIIYQDKGRVNPLVTIRFAANAKSVRASSDEFRSPSEFRKWPVSQSLPLAGLKIAIDPADIGGKWAKMEDRSVQFKGYGLINEGDLNVVVGRLLKERLERLGATVLLVRNKSEPVLDTTPQRLEQEARRLLRENPRGVPSSMGSLVSAIRKGTAWRIRREANQLYTKTLESRARERFIRRNFYPDFTLILQHNATAESAKGRLTKIGNRNIFFVSGMYGREGLNSSSRRFHLLRKLFGNVTSVETSVAGAISDAFKAETGYKAVMYGNSSDTRLVIPGNNYVVARNLMFTREHDGPTIVTEPYFMNDPVTLARLLAGDYAGERKIAGQMRKSIHREYADCVTTGILKAYGHK